MKKLLSFSVAALLAVGAQAQATRTSHLLDKTLNKTKLPDMGMPNTVSLGNAAKTTGIPFWTENFGTGTTTSLPVGWTASGNGVSQTWKWNNVAETSQYTAGLPTINSTTKANGWMVYNSDTIGTLNPTVLTLTGTLTGPAFSTVGHSSVNISFQQFFRRLNDSCFLEVTNDNFATFTRFSISPNNTMPANTSLANPTLTSINVSSVAGNKPAVRLRFVYFARAVNTNGGGYLWSIDDIAAADLDPVDLELTEGAFVMTKRSGSGDEYTSFSSYPRQLADTVFPLVQVSNRGGTAPATVSFTANVSGPTGASVYSKSVVFTNVPVSAMDSTVEFRRQAGFVPTAIGTYTAAFATNPTGEATPGNNIDSATFVLSDSLLSRNESRLTSAYYAHRPSSHSAGEGANFVGTIIDIPAGKSDTLTGVSVVFDSRSVLPAGTNATIQIYDISGVTATFKANSRPVLLTTANISATGAPKYTYFPMAITATNIGSFILNGGTNGGTYVAVVQGDNNAPSSSVLVATSAAIGKPYVGASGLIYESLNDNGTDFGASDIKLFNTGDATPFVRMHFGNYKAAGTDTAKGVNNISGLVGSVAAYPNPSSTQLFVPVTLSNAANLSVTLSTPMGQVVARQDFGKVAAGQEVKATFNTAGLANGIYFYTVEVSGERITNRVVVSH